MTPLVVDQAPFSFGAVELLFTALAAGIVFAILGPRWLRQRRERKKPGG